MSQATVSTPEYQPLYPDIQKYLQGTRPDYIQSLGIKTQVYTEWDGQPYKFITDNFCHQNLGKVKLIGKGSRSLVNISQAVSTKKGQISTQEDIKVSFSLPKNRALSFQSKPQNYLKLTYDHGLTKYSNKYYYLSGEVNANKILQNTSLKLCLNVMTKNCYHDNTLKGNFGKNNQYYFYHKTYIGYHNFRFGFISVFNFNYKILQKNDILFGYHFRPDTSAYLRAYLGGFRLQNPNPRRIYTIFDRLTANFIHKVDDKSKIGLQGTLNIEDKSLQEIKAVYQYTRDNNLYKASLSSKMNVAFALKRKLPGMEDKGTLSVGLGVEGLTNKKIDYKSGFEIEINL